MKAKIILVFFALILISYGVYAEDCNGCSNPSCSNSCCAFGDVAVVNGVSFYCDLNTISLVQQKTSGACSNNFECTQNYTCMGNNCTNAYNNYLNNQTAINQLAGLMNFCFGEGLFCSISASAPSNSSLETSKNCSYLGDNYKCYKCNSGLTWNETLVKCIPPACSESPGCLNMSSLANASEVLGYCNNNYKCFKCASDYDWNSSSSSCRLKTCNSVPGCLNQTNLTHASSVNRACSNGFTCFDCSSGYGWEGNVCKEIVGDLDSDSDSLEWSTVTLTSAQFQNGIPIDLSVRQRVYVTIEGVSHWIGVTSIVGNAVTLSINSQPQTAILTIGETEKVEVSGDSYYDLAIKLNSITNNKANLAIMGIHESMIPVYTNTQTNTAPRTGTSTTSAAHATSDESTILYIVFGFLVLMIIVVVVLIVYSMKKPMQKSGGLSN